MGALVVDASVVIGLFEPDDSHHSCVRAAVADARLNGAEFVLPASVLSEATVGAYRHGVAADRHRRIVRLFGPVRPVDEEVALAAAQLRARHHSLRLPDALVLATSIVDGAAVLTCDRRWEGVQAQVHLIKPD